MKREILFTIAVTLVLAGIIRAAQDGTGTNVFESVRIKDGRSVTFGGETRTNWPEGGSTVFGVTDETAYRGDWGAVISNLVIYGPLLTNTTDVFFGRGAYAGYGGIAIGAGATNEEGGIAIGKDSRSGLVGISIGLFAQSAELGVSIGRFAEADMYGIAIGDNASAVEDAVAIGGNVKNTNANTTKILGKLIIPGGGPTNGAVWIATNTAGMGTWKVLSKFRSYATNSYSIGGTVNTKIYFEAAEFNVNDTYNTNTSKWIPGRAGYVHVGAQLYSTNAVAAKTMSLKICRDGNVIRIARANPAGAVHSWSMSLIDYCPSNTNEYEIFAENQSAVLAGIRGSSALTFFWGYELP